MDAFVSIVVELFRMVGSAVRRWVLRLRWEESNDAVDTGIGIIASSAILWLAIWVARSW